MKYFSAVCTRQQLQSTIATTASVMTAAFVRSGSAVETAHGAADRPAEMYVAWPGHFRVCVLTPGKIVDLNISLYVKANRQDERSKVKVTECQNRSHFASVV